MPGFFYCSEQAGKKGRCAMSKSQIFCLVFTGVLMFASPVSWAASGCFDYSSTIALSGDPQNPYGLYFGEKNASIGNQSFEHVPTTLIIGTPKLGDDGTLHAVDTVVVDFGDLGTLILTEHAVVSPTDTPYVYRVNSRFDICVSEGHKCTGYFENAFGRLSFHGYVDFSTASVSGSDKGSICW
jgi:hypothetical protein